jgi:hypothetical protein
LAFRLVDSLLAAAGSAAGMSGRGHR